MCLHNICVYCVYLLSIYKYTHTRVRPLLCVSCVPASCVLFSCHYEFISCPAVFDNTNNSLHLYSAFLGTQSALHSKGGGGGGGGGCLLNHHQCAASTWMMRRLPYCARTPPTHQLQVERRQWWSRWGNLTRMPRSHLYSFSKDILSFYDHRESGPRFNVSSERRCLLTV